MLTPQKMRVRHRRHPLLLKRGAGRPADGPQPQRPLALRMWSAAGAGALMVLLFLAGFLRRELFALSFLLGSVILDTNHPSVGAETFTTGNWPATAFNTGIWHFTFTPTAASTTYVGGNFYALFADQSSHGGLWLNDNKIEMYTAPGDALVFSQTMTWSANQTISITIDTRSGTRGITISGATTGNGTFTFSTAGNYFDSTQSLGVGSLPGSSGYRFGGAISDVDDTATGGVLNKTLGTLTVSSAGTVAVAGTLTKTLGAATSSAAGTVAVAGTASPTLGALTSSGTGTVAVSGAATVTMGALTVSADGSVGSTPISGAAAITLGAATGSGAGTVAVAGQAAITLGTLTSSATATTPDLGQASITLGPLTANASGTVSLSGSAAITLGTLTLQADGGGLPPLGVGLSSSVTRINLASPGSGSLTTFATDLTISSVTNGTDTFTATAHGMITSDGPYLLATTGTFPTGSDGTTEYWVNVTGANTFRLSLSPAASIAGTVVNITSDGSGTITLKRAIATSTTGSAFVTGVARGSWATTPDAPTDNKGNSYVAAASSPHAYAGFPSSQAGVYVDLTGAGGSGHTASFTFGELVSGHGDEVVGFILEVTGAAVLQSSSWVERAIGSTTITSASVTTTGPAVLVAVIFGNGPTGQDHTFTFLGGFTRQKRACRPGDISGDGYIQVDVATKFEQEPGTFTFSAQGTNQEGGQLFLLALQAAPGTSGAFAKTLGAVTLSAAGSVPANGNLTKTLGALTLSSVGTNPIAGTAAVTLGGIGLSAAGTAGQASTGAASITLGELTSAAAGAVAVTGGGTPPFAPMTIVAAGGVAVTGQAAVTFGPLVSSAAGRVDVAGASSGQLGSLLASAAGTVTVAGSSAVTLGTMLSTAAGVIGSPAIGDASITLGSLVASATGAVALTGTGAPMLGPLTSSATGGVAATGVLTTTLGPLAASAAGTVQVGGAAGVTLAPLTAIGTGTVVFDSRQGDAAIALSPLTASAAGTVPVQGQANIPLGPLTMFASSATEVTGSLTKTLGALTSTAHGEVRQQGQVAVTLGPLTVASAGHLETFGQATVQFGAVTLVAAGTHPITGGAAILLGPLVSTATGLGAQASNGTAAITLGALKTTIAKGTVGRHGRENTAEGWGLNAELLERARQEGSPELITNPLYRKR